MPVAAAVRALLEQTGFEIRAYDEPDHEKAHDYWFALGYNNGKTAKTHAPNCSPTVLCYAGPTVLAGSLLARDPME